MILEYSLDMKVNILLELSVLKHFSKDSYGFFPEEFQNKSTLTSTVETYIDNWETLISIGVSKEEFLVYRNQLVQRIQNASAHQRLQWRMQLDALLLDSSLENVERSIQNIQYQDVNDAIQRHISKKKHEIDVAHALKDRTYPKYRYNR